MRKHKVEDEAIKGMLRDEFDRCLAILDQIEDTVSKYPRGRLVVKKIKSNGQEYEYHHLQWREGKKVMSIHIPKKDLLEVKKNIEQRDAYLKNEDKLKKRLKYLAPLLGVPKPELKRKQEPDLDPAKAVEIPCFWLSFKQSQKSNERETFSRHWKNKRKSVDRPTWFSYNGVSNQQTVRHSTYSNVIVINTTGGSCTGVVASFKYDTSTFSSSRLANRTYLYTFAKNREDI